MRKEFYRVEEIAMSSKAERFAIVFNDGKWFVRHIRLIEHDLERDEKVYRCDKPIGKNFNTAEEALEAARKEYGR